MNSAPKFNFNEPWEALAIMARGIEKEIARVTSTSLSHVYKWMRPHEDYTDTGSRNDLERLADMMDVALRSGKKSKSEACAPIHWLASRFGFAIFELPDSPTHKGITEELLNAIKEFGQMSEAAAVMLRDGRVDSAEVKKLKKEASEAIERIIGLMKQAEKAAQK